MTAVEKSMNQKDLSIVMYACNNSKWTWLVSAVGLHVMFLVLGSVGKSGQAQSVISASKRQNLQICLKNRACTATVMLICINCNLIPDSLHFSVFCSVSKVYWSAKWLLCIFLKFHILQTLQVPAKQLCIHKISLELTGSWSWTLWNISRCGWGLLIT